MKHDESSRDKQKTASAAKKRPNRMDRVSMLGKCQSTLNSVEANTTLSTENIDTSFEKDLDTKFVIQVGEVAEGTEVGAGNFAVVRKGTYKSKTVAIKRATDAERITDLRREALIMSLLGSHPNVIGFFGVIENPIRIVMEFCVGPLDDILASGKREIKNDEILTYLAETAKGMLYLSEKGCIHRDLATRNILVTDDGILKISDFGMSRQASVSEMGCFAHPKLNFNIPLRWWPPECIRRDPIFTPVLDVWSFGVVIYEMFSNGERPWPEEDPKVVAHRIRRFKMFKFPRECPPYLVELCQRKIFIPHTQRWTFKSINNFINYVQFEVKPTKKHMKHLFGSRVVDPKVERLRCGEQEIKEFQDLMRKESKGNTSSRESKRILDPHHNPKTKGPRARKAQNQTRTKTFETTTTGSDAHDDYKKGRHNRFLDVIRSERQDEPTEKQQHNKSRLA
ncbi:unnamed protein product [Bursaphelenchus xylophilus]|nr:unnamed protein product [Bursaphelenchus xylophilus]CAG9089170.1 unnamed protein product [Bursaphelenchus xylophilus]